MAKLAEAPVSKTGDSRFESWLPRLQTRFRCGLREILAAFSGTKAPRCQESCQPFSSAERPPQRLVKRLRRDVDGLAPLRSVTTVAVVVPSRRLPIGRSVRDRLARVPEPSFVSRRERSGSLALVVGHKCLDWVQVDGRCDMDRVEGSQRRLPAPPRRQAEHGRAAAVRAHRPIHLHVPAAGRGGGRGPANARRTARGISARTSSLLTKSAPSTSATQSTRLSLLADELDRCGGVRVEDRHDSAIAADVVERTARCPRIAGQLRRLRQTPTQRTETRPSAIRRSRSGPSSAPGRAQPGRLRSVTASRSPRLIAAGRR